MKLTSCLFLLILSGFIHLIGQDQQQFDSISSLLPPNVSDWLEANNTPGASIVLIKNGKVLEQQNIGYSDLDKKTPLTNTTSFNVGSISKVITMWGILKLVDQNKIHLDSSANSYLKKWKFPISKCNSDSITIRSLLNHTSGLSVHGYPGYNDKENLPTLVESLSGIPKKSTKVKMVSEPGSRYQYSGGGYSVLQLIIEEVTGDSFTNYMDSAILKPLGMINSSFSVTSQVLSNSSKSYNKRGKQIPFQHFTAQAAAGFQTTMEDMIAFIQAHIQSLESTLNESLISKSYLKLMLEEGNGNRSQLGLQQYSSNNNVAFGHGGINKGWGAVFAIDPKTKDAFIMLTNSFRGKSISDYVLYQWLNSK